MSDAPTKNDTDRMAAAEGKRWLRALRLLVSGQCWPGRKWTPNPANGKDRP